MTNEIAKYPKVMRLGHVEVQGILDHDVIVQEKLDGANMRIHRDSDGTYYVGGRNHIVEVTSQSEHDKGMHRWTRGNKAALDEWFDKYPGTILIAEWMRKHTINYGVDQSTIFPVFTDALYGSGTTFNRAIFKALQQFCNAKELRFAHVLYDVRTDGALSMSDLQQMVDDSVSCLGDGNVSVEGVVIKAPSYTNHYGRQCHAKLVSKRFEESKSVKRSTKNVSGEDANYYDFVHTHCTEARFSKLLQKREVQSVSRAHMKWLPQLMFEDVVLEEGLTLLTTYQVINVKELRKQIAQRCLALIDESMQQ